MSELIKKHDKMPLEHITKRPPFITHWLNKAHYPWSSLFKLSSAEFVDVALTSGDALK